MRSRNVDRGDRLRRIAHGIVGGGLPEPVSALSFWSAIALPAFYLPLLAAGIESVRGLGLFLGLFGLHVVALVIGRHYADATSR